MVRGILYNTRLHWPRTDAVLIHVKKADAIPLSGPVIVIGMPPDTRSRQRPALPDRRHREGLPRGAALEPHARAGARVDRRRRAHRAPDAAQADLAAERGRGRDARATRVAHRRLARLDDGDLGARARVADPFRAVLPCGRACCDRRCTRREPRARLAARRPGRAADRARRGAHDRRRILRRALPAVTGRRSASRSSASSPPMP